MSGNRYVYPMIVRLDQNECLVTHYWTGKRWITSEETKTPGHDLPMIYDSVAEARSMAPIPTHPRSYIWCSGSKAKKTLFKL